jgi:general secretion pathway protein I
MRPQASRGFTLLEVLVAVAILALGLTVVSSAQTGVFWSYSRATRLSQAPGLARCKMAELELNLLKLGFPLLDQTDEGDCCTNIDVEGYRCEWRIETVKLPDLPVGGGSGADAGVGPGGGLGGAPAAQGAGGTIGSPGLGGPLGGLAQIQQTGGSALGRGAGVGDLTSMLGAGGGSGGVASMVMGLVYPDLKPMLEASIRKLTIHVLWKEGNFERDLGVAQYITAPQHGGFDPLAAQGLDALGSGVPGLPGAPGGAAQGLGGAAQGLGGLIPGLSGLGGAK